MTTTEPTPEAVELARHLQVAMGCKVEGDRGECASCYDGYCGGGHPMMWMCDVHDWHEEDNAEGVCGYAVQLARAVLAAGYVKTDCGGTCCSHVTGEEE